MLSGDASRARMSVHSHSLFQADTCIYWEELHRRK